MTLAPPPSKSDAQRALVLADLLGHPRELRGLAARLPADVRVLQAGLDVLARGGGGDLDCRDGGAPLRFLLGQAALCFGATWRFWGTPRLGARPHGPLLEALVEALGPHGLEVEPGSPWPLVVRAPPTPVTVPRFRVRGGESSQFASSLALAAARQVARSGEPCAVEVEGPHASEGYFELTVKWLGRAGFEVERGPTGVVVRSLRPVPELPPVPGDWSSLTYLLPIAWKTGAAVASVAWDVGHPDEVFAVHLRRAGLSYREGPRGLLVEGALERGFEVDAGVCPDAVPALVAVATVAPAPSRFSRVGVLRLKESDRVEGVAALAQAFGATVRVEAETLTVVPGAPVAAVRFDPRGDHRLAMAATVAAVLQGAGLALTDPACVDKSFPGFFEEVGKTGWSLSP